MLDECASAATNQAPVQTQQLSSVIGDRPPSHAFLDRIRRGWAELLTGRCTTADLLHQLFSMSEIALDKRQSATVAERAAVRYVASHRHKAFLNSLCQGSETAALSVWGSTLSSENPHLASQLLEEESKITNSSSRGPKAETSSAQPSQDAVLPSQQRHSCLLWLLGQCHKSDCNFEHICPFKGSASGGSGGCILRPAGHLQTFQKPDVRNRIMGSNKR